jgi:hypothetical protein
MIIVKGLKVSRQISADEWKKRAIGTTDEYGNPFRIIKLRWNNNRMHRNADHAKTRGFEDAVIGRDRRNGDIEITYRQNGSVEWMRPSGGVGPFMGEVAETPRNMRLLTGMFGDKLFTIVDSDILQVVKKMYEDREAKMDPKVKEFNNKRIRSMHTMYVEAGEKAETTELPVEVEREEIKEGKSAVQRDKIENAKRKAELDKKEEEINKKVVELVGDGAVPSMYSRDFLQEQKFYKLRGICREMKVSFAIDDKKVDLIKKVLEKQTGNSKEVKKQMAGVIGGGLDD